MVRAYVYSAVAIASTAVLTALYHWNTERQNNQKLLKLISGNANINEYRNRPIVIAVDIGSSSIRASCFVQVKISESNDANKQSGVKAKSNESHIEWVLIDGSMQQLQMDIIDKHGHANIIQIKQTVEKLLDQALDFLRAAKLTTHIAGVGFSSFVMNILGVNKQGEPTTPVYTYAGRKPETAKYAHQLREQFKSQSCMDDFHNRTGAVIHPAYAPAEFLRLHNEEPELVAKVHKWQSVSGYLLCQWISPNSNDKNEKYFPMSYSEASWTGLFDFRREKWDSRILSECHMEMSKMPSVHDSSMPFKGLKPKYAKKWHELTSVPFFLGVGDGAAANFGSKCIDSRRVAVTIGTSAALRVVLPLSDVKESSVPRGLWCYRISSDHVLLGGALSDGGSVFQFFTKLLKLDYTPELENELREHIRNARDKRTRVTVLPFLSGERAPGWHEHAACAITGISKWTTPTELLYAGMESVALRIAVLYSLIESHTTSNSVVIASGTALRKSEIWRQMIANAIGKEILIESNTTETTSRGVAILVGTYLHLHNYCDSQRIEENSVNGNISKVYPNVDDHKASLAAKRTQEHIYAKLYS